MVRVRLRKSWYCNFIALAGFAVAMLGTSAVEAAPTGAALAEAKGCVTCHGIDGVGTGPTFPNLAGQWERYLRVQLRAYRTG